MLMDWYEDFQENLRKSISRSSEDISHSPDKVTGMSDKEMLDKISKAEHPSIIARYQIAMMLRLKEEISELNKSIKEFSKASYWSSWVMIILTAVIAVLTVVLLFK